ncbi:MAG: hypothetical protein CL910_22650 [Deltaproteobacteria bacterium]|nr:hypothetical protein [Deltaproteobacteria bacterium]
MGVVVAGVGATPAAAAYEDAPEAHAPIGVMGDHIHDRGEWMLSYRYMRMNMNGNRDGTARESASKVRRQFMVAPTDMDMEMHMLGVMYAPTHTLTLMAMVPFVRLDMNHIRRDGVRFRTRSKGLGDVSFSGLYQVYQDDTNRIHLNLGFSAPTGSISRKDETPLGRVRLPYPMQLGSGTWDLRPGVSYRGFSGDYGWGAQVTGTVRMGRNRKGYRLGHGYEITGWASRAWTNWISTSLRLAWSESGNFSGKDDALRPGMIPTADPKRRAGSRLDAMAGVNLALRGMFEGHRLFVEAGRPIYQSLDGPQLERDWTLSLGWQLAF